MPDAGDAALMREAVRGVCAEFGDVYWRTNDRSGVYPEEFVARLTADGWLSIHIPQELGGGGGTIADACVVMEAINRSGANGSACHAQMYALWVLLRAGSAEQRKHFLPLIARGDLRLQAFGVTEPDAGSDTPRITTVARRDGDEYVINGRKVFTSRVQHSDLMLLLTRTSPYDASHRTAGMTLFLVDLRTAGAAIQVDPIPTMINHETNALFIDELRVPASSRLGAEGDGFRCLLDALNVERVLIASECLGDARWFVERACAYAQDRTVFGAPIGRNQGVQFPLAKVHMQIEAVDGVRWRAASAFDAEAADAGALATMAKYLASEVAIEAGDVAMNTFGGWGMTTEYDIERKFRETRLYRVAPISNNLVLAFVGQHVLRLGRSY